MSYAFSYNFGTIVHVTFKIALGYSCNYANVTSTIIPKLYSNAGDYLYLKHSLPVLRNLIGQFQGTKSLTVFARLDAAPRIVAALE